ncbi:MAG: hypothetical protein EOO48_14275 [Flavobacterium sp.]|nr:MAG: hypothetical protein EOO48_14275 [Flavobacterium sp.]
MPTNERNHWDRANAQGENQTDFNREKPENEYQDAKQESADATRNESVNNPNDENIDENSDPEKPDFLTYGTSDEDMQF